MSNRFMELKLENKKIEKQLKKWLCTLIISYFFIIGCLLYTSTGYADWLMSLTTICIFSIIFMIARNIQKKAEKINSEMDSIKEILDGVILRTYQEELRKHILYGLNVGDSISLGHLKSAHIDGVIYEETKWIRQQHWWYSPTLNEDWSTENFETWLNSQIFLRNIWSVKFGDKSEIVLIEQAL